MGIYETFSKRRKREKGDKVDPYRYDAMPHPFKVQVVHIWKDALGPYVTMSSWDYGSPPASNKLWSLIHDQVAREKGVFSLSDSGYSTPMDKCIDFLLNSAVEDALDIIELSFRLVDKVVRTMNSYERKETRINQDPDEAITELNHRFREHSVGYQFVDGVLVQMDSDYTHQEAIKPALVLLHEQGFGGPSEEFMKAHDHYRHGRHKEAITEGLKAFESTMKAICDAQKWSYPPTATARTLIDTVLKRGLIPAPLASTFNNFRAAMESGLPTVRNKLSGHGQGAQPIEVPDYVAGYALNLAASNIVLLVRAHKSQS